MENLALCDLIPCAGKPPFFWPSLFWTFPPPSFHPLKLYKPALPSSSSFASRENDFLSPPPLSVLIWSIRFRPYEEVDYVQGCQFAIKNIFDNKTNVHNCHLFHVAYSTHIKKALFFLKNVICTPNHMATMGPAKANALGESQPFFPLPDSQDYVYGVAFCLFLTSAIKPPPQNSPKNLISRSPK